jgi:DNA mismatch endonuclease, patch repair protein
MSRWPEGANKQKTTFGSLTRSQLMSRVQSRGNKTTELVAARLLRENGFKGWRRHVNLIGKPDFVWPKTRLALFIDGCFWHGHGCGRNLTPRTNAALWQQKIDTNKQRDRRNDRALRRTGWTVLRIWECSLAKDQARCVERLKRAVGNNRCEPQSKE